MVITRIQGGLGNQLFQWAHARALSLKYNIPCYLDIHDVSGGGTHRDFTLDVFPNLYYELANINSISNVIVDNFNFSPITMTESEVKNSVIYLNGYWQTEKYFIEYADIIRNELRSNVKIDLGNSTSLHVRRTDYLKSNGFHPVQPIEYYEKAISLIGDYERLLVFSDDIQWCKDNLKFDNMTFIEGYKDYEDIWTMSMCKNNIIVNSSFSWWGAWLNENPDKKVIAPLNWFGPQSNLNTSDIIPNEWIKI